MALLLPNLTSPLRRSSSIRDGAVQQAVGSLEAWADMLVRRLSRLETSTIVSGGGAVTSVTGTGVISVSPTVGDVVVSANLSGYATGSGSTNRVAKWTGSSALGDSSITDTGSLVTVANPTAVLGNLTVGASAVTRAAFTSTCEITKDGAYNAVTSSVYSSGPEHAEFSAFRGRGTAAASSAVQSGDVLGQYSFTGATSSTEHHSGVLLQGVATENWIQGSNSGARVSVWTTPNASSPTLRAVRLTIDQDGQVLIGSQTSVSKASLAGKLEVLAPDGSGTNVVVSTYGTGVNPQILMFRGRGTAASSLAVQSGDSIGTLTFAGSVGGTGVFSSAFVQGWASENWGGGRGSYLGFVTCTNGTTSRLTRLKVENDGGITLSNSATAATSAASELRLRYNTTGHVLQVSANGGAYATVPTGTGTANTLPKWNNTTGALTNSTISDTGSIVTVSNALTVTGNVQLGDADADSHTVRGNLTISKTAANAVTDLRMNNDVRSFFVRVDGSTGTDDLRLIDATRGANVLVVTGTTGDGAWEAGFTVKGNATLCDAAGDTLKFHGGTGATQQTITGSRGGNAALADLLTKLATLGLIVDGTTA